MCTLCVLLLWALLCPGRGQADEFIRKAVGSDVTLVPVFSGSPTEIIWKVEGHKLVDMELNPLSIKFYRLWNRATINKINGELSIKNLNKGDTGAYKAEALVDNIMQETNINLKVLGQADEVIHKEVGSDVTLVPVYSGSPTEIIWKVDGHKLVDMELNPLHIIFYRLRTRAAINESNGELTIKKLSKGDTGVYKAEALVDNVRQETNINLIVLECLAKPAISNRTIEGNIIELHCESSTPNVNYQWWEKTQKISSEQSYNVSQTKENVLLTCVVSNEACENNVTVIIPPIPGQADEFIRKAVGSDVTLVPVYSGSPAEIIWKVDGHKLVDMELNPLHIIFYRLRTRATINERNGELTIRNLNKEDTGVYKAEALVDNIIQEANINLIVLGQADEFIRKAVGSDVTLVPVYSGSPAEINWKVDGHKLVDIELNPLSIIFYRLRDRVTINERNGEITIRNLNKEDTGVYKAEALVDNVMQVTNINLIVLE